MAAAADLRSSRRSSRAADRSTLASGTQSAPDTTTLASSRQALGRVVASIDRNTRRAPIPVTVLDHRLQIVDMVPSLAGRCPPGRSEEPNPRDSAPVIDRP